MKEKNEKRRRTRIRWEDFERKNGKRRRTRIRWGDFKRKNGKMMVEWQDEDGEKIKRWNCEKIKIKCE